jgi:TAG lipase/lysophosphatidylethanolamine acyltransferase
MTLVPELKRGDFLRLLETPTREGLDWWILRGERSVWPCVAGLKVRQAVEGELDRGYQFVRRRKAGGLRRRGSAVDNSRSGGLKVLGSGNNNGNANGNGNGFSAA